MCLEKKRFNCCKTPGTFCLGIMIYSMCRDIPYRKIARPKKELIVCLAVKVKISSKNK